MKIFLYFVLLCWCSVAYAEPDYPKLCEAIRISEGVNSRYPYGIKSINTHGDIRQAKRICLNTVLNNWKRWNNRREGDNRDYLTFLRDRYAPLSDSPLNNNWKRNVLANYKGGAI